MENASVSLQYRVGVFVAIGLLLGCLTILALGGNRVLFTRYLHVRGNFSQVQGLFPGSVVSLAGLPIGNVKEIRFAADSNRLEVVMQIDQQFKSRVREGTTAEIRTQGALGDKYVYLEPGDPTKPELTENALLTTVGDEDLMKILTSKEDGVVRVLDLIKEMHLLVASMNKDNRMGNTAQNLSESTAQLKATLKEVHGLVADLRSQLPENKKFREAIASLSSIMTKVDSGKGTLGALVNDPSIHQSLKTLLGSSPRSNYMKEMVRESVQRGEQAR